MGHRQLQRRSPYDKFIVAQIAADQSGDPTNAPATGFLTLGRRYLNAQPDIINDRIDVVTRGLLGRRSPAPVATITSSIRSAPPTTIAMYGVFASSEEKPRDDAPPPEFVDSAKLYDPYVFLRGSPGNRGPATERRFLTCLTPDHKPTAFKQGSGRREMADAIASRENPLTARVWVNRIWGDLLGQVPGRYTERLRHPRHTAHASPNCSIRWPAELMEDQWSTKRLVRRIVLSNIYRQSSGLDECACR